MSASVKPEERDVARHIAREAARLFARRGYEATSIREIVEAAGVAKPTLYYYFGSKEGLAKAILIEPLEVLAKRLGEIVQATSDPIVALEEILEAHFAYCREDPDRSRLFFAVVFGPPESEIGLLLECRKGNLQSLLEAVILRCVDAGVVPSDHADEFATMYRGMIVISIIDFLYHEKPLEADRARVLVAALLQGFVGGRDAGGPDGLP